MQISSSTMINAPLTKVFDTFTDLNQAKKNISGIEQLEILDGSAKMKVGTKWKETRTVFGKEATEIMWVSDLTPNKSYTVDAESHGTKYRSTFTFEEKNGGTNVSWVFEGTPQSFFAKAMSLVAFLFTGATKKLLEQDLNDLKKACEA